MQSSSEADEVRALERQRFRALRDGDLDALDRLLAEELSYTHSDNSRDTKSSLLAKIRDSRLECSGARHDPDEHVVVGGDTAIATGQVSGTVRVDGATVPLHNRALAVWSRRKGEWRLLAYQSTPLPAAAAKGSADGGGKETA
jgi:ketosteroid isomerase-like protein